MQSIAQRNELRKNTRYATSPPNCTVQKMTAYVGQPDDLLSEESSDDRSTGRDSAAMDVASGILIGVVLGVCMWAVPISIWLVLR